ncbi:MAG TPA: hypothetical protein VFN67_24030 [Polyangiales bacterium]|nr:hypothetical protein [Polyangiales bacterium]
MSKKNRSKPAITKSDVIRSMPHASAGAIIKKAKSYGLELTANHVYAVRAIDKRRGRPARLGGGPATFATPARASTKSKSKTAFIRGFTRDTPASKVVEAAKRAGVKITKAYVYRVRALKEPAQRPHSGAPMSAIARGSSRRDPGAERRLTSLALEIGLLRASVLLDRVRAKLGE